MAVPFKLIVTEDGRTLVWDERLHGDDYDYINKSGHEREVQKLKDRIATLEKQLEGKIHDC